LRSLIKKIKDEFLVPADHRWKAMLFVFPRIFSNPQNIGDNITTSGASVATKSYGRFLVVSSL